MGIWNSLCTVSFPRFSSFSFEFYKSLDSALNEIYVVSNLTSGAVSLKIFLFQYG